MSDFTNEKLCDKIEVTIITGEFSTMDFDKIAYDLYTSYVRDVEQAETDSDLLDKIDMSIKFDVITMSAMLAKRLQLARYRYDKSFDFVVYCKNLITDQYELAYDVVKTIYAKILVLSRTIADNKYKRKFTKVSILDAVKETLILLENNESLCHTIKPLDTSKFIPLKNAIIDRQDKSIATTSSDVITRLPWNWLSDEQFNHPKYKVFNEICKRLLSDWSNNDKDTELSLRQACLASIEGDGRQSIVLLYGHGANGKSSMIKLCSALVGKYNVATCSLHQLGDPNYLNQIDINTMLIASAELARRRISDRSVVNIEMLTQQEVIRLSNKAVETRSLIMQGSDHEVELCDKQCHVVVMPICDVRYDFNEIDKLARDESFVEYFGNYILRETDEFDVFASIKID